MLQRSRFCAPLLLILVTATACSTSAPTSQTPAIGVTLIAPLSSAPPTSTATAATARPPQIVPTAPAVGFCLDQQPASLINGLKTALLTAEGTLLASLVDPAHGMDVQLLRNGTVVNYDPEHARHLFESTYTVDWGPAPGSGLPVQGSFHELVLPALLDVFSSPYSLACSELRVGGVTYTPSWPYPAIDFYSVYVPGTAANGELDWHTWVLGMHHAAGKLYLYALTQFQWEP